MQIMVRDNNVDQALRALKKKGCRFGEEVEQVVPDSRALNERNLKPVPGGEVGQQQGANGEGSDEIENAAQMILIEVRQGH